ncbi:hypothetical protein WA158_008037 [Blastocystis sp. Blastoise]
MYIKKVIISGFRSYRDQLEFDNIDPGLNIILGKNGSGKSNFFNAIRFVLRNDYVNLDEEERRKLLYEGSGAPTVSAFVEILFDNSDRRFPIDDDEVTITRSISIKKDEYYVNTKHYSRNDIDNLLESAGFSHDNPYYIVEQGKISTIAEMTEEQRLILLKEIAGTRIYEEKRSETAGILRETEGQQKKITGVIDTMSKKLSELENEKEELARYTEKERERRAIEYTIYNQDIYRCNNELEKEDNRKRLVTNDLNDIYAQYESIHSTLEDLRDSRGELTLQKENNTARLEEIQRELEGIYKRVIELEGGRKEREEQEQEREQKKLSIHGELEALERDLFAHKQELETLLPSYTSLESQYSDLQRKQREILSSIDGHDRRVNVYNGFQSERERNEYIQTEYNKYMEMHQSRGDTVKGYGEDIEGMNRDIEETREQEKEDSSLIKEYKEQENQFKQKLQSIHENRGKLSEQKKEIWNSREKLLEDISLKETKLESEKRKYNHMLPLEVREGLEAINQYVQLHGIKGVYGPLISLLSPKKPGYATCIDIVGGSALFNCVVENDEITTELMEFLRKENRGRVTFLPLNRLVERNIVYPSRDDVYPLIDTIDFDSKYFKAMNLIFGGICICESLYICSQVSKEYNMDTITLEGDRVYKRGGMRGGYYNPGNNRLFVYNNLTSLKQDLSSSHQSLDELDKKLETIKQQELDLITDDTRTRDLLTTVRNSLESTYSRQTDRAKTIRVLLERKTQTEQQLQIEQSKYDDIDAHVHELERDIQIYIEKKDDTEVEDINTKQNELRTIQLQLKPVSAQYTEMRQHKQELETFIQEIYSRKKTDLETELNTKETNNDLDIDGTQLQTARDQQKDRESQRDILKQSIVESDKQLADLNDEISNQEAQENEVQTVINGKQKEIEALLHKRQIRLTKRDHIYGYIRGLGNVNVNDINKYKDLSMSQLLARLKVIRGELTQFGKSVNRKAVEQYIQYNDNYTEFVSREQELEAGNESINDLIKTLDLRKSETITRTYKQVAVNFATIFKQLIPAGNAELILKLAPKDNHGNDDDPNDKDDDNHGNNDTPLDIDDYVGMGMRVSFDGHVTYSSLGALSGGQKTILALALIMAIQRSDPGPFYLFDELDSNLDATYRHQVASLLQKQTEQHTQIIISTFKPEIIPAANQIFELYTLNRASSVRTVSIEEAEAFVNQEIERETGETGEADGVPADIDIDANNEEPTMDIEP